MDPCPFVRLIVESLALKLPAMTRPAGSGVHPSTSPCFCVLQLQDCPSSTQTAPLPLASAVATAAVTLTEDAPSSASSAPVIFTLDPGTLQRLASKPAGLTVSVYTGRTGSTCGFSSGRLLGRVRVGLGLEPAASLQAMVMQSGWVSVGIGRAAPRLHLVVRSEPDPRFVFQFGGEPECSPVVYQVQGSGRQPVFSCRFSANSRRSTRSRSLPSDSSTNRVLRAWFGSFSGERDHHLRRRRGAQRKGWTVMIHDLSGFPVAAASMVTPFVPSPNSDRVSRSNPGAWLILRPAPGPTLNWKPWGRLEAWRERGPTHALGLRFELVTESGPGRVIAESSLGVRKGGEFRIDPGAAGGFVMGSTVEGEGQASKPTVQVAAQHVSCMADVALFVALSAAVDLSMDACRLFSQKLRKELCQDEQECSVF